MASNNTLISSAIITVLLIALPMALRAISSEPFSYTKKKHLIITKTVITFVCVYIKREDREQVQMGYDKI